MGVSDSSEGERTLDVTVDGNRERIPFAEGESLMTVLRRGGYYAVKNGCSEGICGSCNVLHGDNQIARSCLVPASQYDGAEITTASGLVADDGSLHPVQEAFLDFGAAQCGFCIPGMIVSAVQLLEKEPDPSREQIRKGLRGNICRCTGYVQQFEAIERAADHLREADAVSADD